MLWNFATWELAARRRVGAGVSAGRAGRRSV